MDIPFVYEADDYHSDAWSVHAAGRRGHRSTTSLAQSNLYAQQQGTSAPISPLDIHQGSIGDCYLLSAIGEIARSMPSFIQNMIHTTASDAETVTLYEDVRGVPVGLNTTSFKAVQVSVDNSKFARNGVNSSQSAVAGSLPEIWPQVVEEAYANLNGGYKAIGNGGYDLVAMETLTGKIAQYVPITSASLNRLQSLDSGSLVEFDTPNKSNLGFNLVGDHAYMFDGLVNTAQGVAVQLLNPWGTHEPDLIPWTKVAQTFQSLTIGHV